MPVDQERVVALALASLEEERKRIDDEIAQLRSQVRGKPSASKNRARAAKARKTKAARGRTAKQMVKTSAAMKKLWAKARKAGFSNLKDYKASLGKA